ncbi:MAG: hypothetical protein LC737_05495, partial [Chloroflexi bacterium]|nr:hypothetical protein [Chloroflexota bacterium]
MSAGDILDGAFSLYRHNFTTAVGIVALINVPLIALQLCVSLFTLPTEPLFQQDPTLSSVLVAVASAVSLVSSLLGA